MRQFLRIPFMDKKLLSLQILESLIPAFPEAKYLIFLLETGNFSDESCRAVLEATAALAKNAQTLGKVQKLEKAIKSLANLHIQEAQEKQKEAQDMSLSFSL